MAKVYLESTDTAFTISNNNTTVYGASGDQVVTVASGVTGVTYDQNTERVVFAGASSAYTYAQSGNQILVYSGGVLVATIPVQGDTNGTQLTFTNGTANAVLTTGVMALGGTTVSGTTTTPAAVTPATIDTTVVSGTVTGGAVTGQSFTLTSNSTSDVFALTSGNDTVTGAAGTLAAGDTIIDSTTTDTDTATLAITAYDAAITPTIAKVETVNVNGSFNTTGLALTNVTGAKTLNLNTGITSGDAKVTNVSTSTAEKIVFGANVSTATLTEKATVGTAGTVNVDTGSVTSLTLTGGTTADSYALTTNGDISITETGTVESWKITPTVASKTVTLLSAGGTGETLDIGGSVATTIKGTDSALTARTITKSGTGALTIDVNSNVGGATDLSKVAADAIVLSANLVTESLTVKNGASISTAYTQTALTIVAPTATSTTNAVTLTNTKSTQTSIATTSVKTLTINSAATQVAGVDATYSTLNAGTDNVVFTGTNDVIVTTGTAASVDASALVGFLNYTQSAAAATTVKGGSGANIVTLKNTTQAGEYVGQNGGDTVTSTATISGAGTLQVTTGSGADTVSVTGITSGLLSATTGAGNDTVTIGSGLIASSVVAFDGGDGTDTLMVTNATDFTNTTLNLTSVETIGLTAAGTMTFTAAQMSGKTYTIQGTATTATDTLAVTGASTTTSIDLSTLTMDQTITKGISKTTINATASSAAATVKGTAVSDTITVSANGSTVTGGNGADSISGAGGTDKFVYTATTGALLKTESAGAYGADGLTAPVSTPGTYGDKIASFTSGTDKIVLSLALGTSGATSGLVASGGTSYTTSSTGLGADDFLTTTLGGTPTAITANTAGGGRFIFDTAGKLLIYDMSGDSAINASGAYTAGAADDFVVVTTTGTTLVATDFIFA